MTEKERERKLNNEGFSLIEVLVAVIIIALVAGPILMSFVMSSRFNKDARISQDVNTVADSFMEEFKGGSLEAVYTNPSLHHFDAVSFDGTGKYTFSAKNYDFVGAKYDIRAIVTPKSTSTVVETEPIGDNDFVFMQDLSYDKSCYDYLVGEVYNAWNAAASFGSDYPYITDADKKDYISVDRVIKVNVGTNADSSKTVTVTYIYNYSVAEKTYTNPVTGDITVIPSYTGSISSDVSWAPKPGAVYTKNYASATPLNRIYLCYSPVYASSSECRVRSDRIDITGAGVHTVYILKQQNPYLSGNLSYMEANYRMYVTGSNYYHNLDINLSSGNYDPTITYADSSKSLYLNPGTSMLTDKNLVYDVKIEVYENGAYGHFGSKTPLYTLSGTMNSD